MPHRAIALEKSMPCLPRKRRSSATEPDRAGVSSAGGISAGCAATLIEAHIMTQAPADVRVSGLMYGIATAI